MDTALKSLLMRHEGLRLKPYRDTAGKLTIGVGRNLDDVGISFDEAMALLESDVAKATQYANSVFPWFASLSLVRQSVVVSLIFNLGMGGILQFKEFLKAMGAADYLAASNELLNSHWASEVGDRARELAAMIETGAWISS